jgi:hypothetical protein
LLKGLLQSFFINQPMGIWDIYDCSAKCLASKANTKIVAMGTNPQQWGIDFGWESLP